MKSVKCFLSVMAALIVLSSCGSGSTAPPAAASASSDDYPAKTVQFVIAANPGGGTDNTCRLVVKYLKEMMGWNVVIAYIEGGGGTVGNRTVKEAIPDGYTLSYFNHNTINNNLAGLADFGMEIYDNVLVPIIVNTQGFSSNKFKTNDEIVKYGKANPGKLRFGIEIGTTSAQIAAAWLMQYDIEATLIDCGAVNGQVAALAGDHVDIITVPINTIKDYLANGEFYLVAIPSTMRHQAFPDTPTFLELGIDIVLPSFYYIGFPAGTPPAIARKFEAAIKTLYENPSYIADQEKLNVTPVLYSLEESAKYITEVTEMMKKNNQYVVDYEKKYGKL
ncbi:MAG: tripartite tricarboxylate transporter substrate binding protein [Spirochaetales bacterium]|jgi:tripartite-type tricarboxylate transporter receptor subunit TctC|nr:tripartite tricarboxylate transporter substrate binding protein [Spirochaetales bacterium]